MSGACKFAAGFAKGIHGGKIEANEAHTWLRKGSRIIDYTASSKDTMALLQGRIPETMRGYFEAWDIEVPENLYEPDIDFMMSDDFIDSTHHNQPRIDRWIEEWRTLEEESKKGWLTSLFENAPRTLFHGTLKEYLPEIMKHGIVPTVGDFVSSFYDRSYDDDYDPEIDSLEPLVFAAKRADIIRCFNAIRHRLVAKGIRPTPENIIEYGAVIVIKDAEEEFVQHDYETDPYAEHPVQVEPGDFYSDRTITPAYILRGNKLRDLFRRQRIDGFWSPRPPIRQ